MLNRLFYVIALSMLALNLVGCTKPVVPTDLVSKIEQKLTELFLIAITRKPHSWLVNLNQIRKLKMNFI